MLYAKLKNLIYHSCIDLICIVFPLNPKIHFGSDQLSYKLNIHLFRYKYFLNILYAYKYVEKVLLIF